MQIDKRVNSNLIFAKELCVERRAHFPPYNEIQITDKKRLLESQKVDRDTAHIDTLTKISTYGFLCLEKEVLETSCYLPESSGRNVSHPRI